MVAVTRTARERVVNPETAVILYNVPVNTQDETLLNLFPDIGRPIRITYLSRELCLSRYTDSCVLEFESVNQVSMILLQSPIKINDIRVEVGRLPRNLHNEAKKGNLHKSRILHNVISRGEYKLLIEGMKYEDGEEAHNVLRKLFETCKCADVQILKKEEKITGKEKLSGVAKVRFHTSKGRAKAHRICDEIFDAELGGNWTVKKRGPR